MSLSDLQNRTSALRFREKLGQLTDAEKHELQNSYEILGEDSGGKMAVPMKLSREDWLKKYSVDGHSPK